MTALGARRRIGTAPDDGAPISQLAKDFKVPVPTITAWLGWDRHPALGRRIRWGYGKYDEEYQDKQGRRFTRGHRGKLVSRADMEVCARAVHHPIRFSFPGNPGVWAATCVTRRKDGKLIPGIFRHNDGRQFITDDYARENYEEFRSGGTRLVDRFYRHRQDHNDRLVSIEVTWPSSPAGPASRRAGGQKRWLRLVFSEESVQRMLERRAGKGVEGGWEEGMSGLTWVDSGGYWYTGRYLLRKAQQNVNPTTGKMWTQLEVADFIARSGHFADPKTRKKVPLGLGRQWVIAYRESVIRPLIGIGGARTVGPAAAPTAKSLPIQGKRRRGRPEETDPEFDRRVSDMWKSGHYPTRSDVARELGIKAREVITALDRHRKRTRNNSSV